MNIYLDPHIPDSEMGHGQESCRSVGRTVSLGCTRPRDHDGQHWGSGVTNIIGIWDDNEEAD